MVVVLAEEGGAGLAALGVTGDPPSDLGGMRSLIASKPRASSNDIILWLAENPCRAGIFEKEGISFREFFLEILLEKELTIT